MDRLPKGPDYSLPAMQGSLSDKRNVMCSQEVIRASYDELNDVECAARSATGLSDQKLHDLGYRILFLREVSYMPDLPNYESQDSSGTVDPYKYVYSFGDRVGKVEAYFRFETSQRAAEPYDNGRDDDISSRDA